MLNAVNTPKFWMHSSCYNSSGTLVFVSETFILYLSVKIDM